MYNDKIRTVRSNFLIHWTGKDIQTDCKKLTFCETQRQEYVHRLRGTIDRLSGGLWMREITEEVHGHDGSKIKHGWQTSATCFTELKLSDIYEHTKRYGCLGFGFDREFVIKRCGIPIQYVSGTEDDNIVENFVFLIATLDDLESFFQYSKVKKFLEDLDEHDYGELMFGPGKFNPKKFTLRNFLNGLKFNISFLKEMSSEDNLVIINFLMNWSGELYIQIEHSRRKR